jgi:hypothetical protein
MDDHGPGTLRPALVGIRVARLVGTGVARRGLTPLHKAGSVTHRAAPAFGLIAHTAGPTPATNEEGAGA